MNTFQLARQQIALNFVLGGTGIGLLFIPHVLLYFPIAQLLHMLSLLCFPIGFYLLGLGVAGVLEGSIHMVRCFKEGPAA